MRRQQWSVELLDEAIAAVSDKLAILRNTDGADRQRIIRLQQAVAALRDDRAKFWRREKRANAQAPGAKP